MIKYLRINSYLNYLILKWAVMILIIKHGSHGSMVTPCCSIFISLSNKSNKAGELLAYLILSWKIYHN